MAKPVLGFCELGGEPESFPVSELFVAIEVFAARKVAVINPEETLLDVKEARTVGIASFSRIGS